MDDSFGHWLAGLIDGEGCFQIRQERTTRWRPTFDLSLRDDDATILREVHAATELGWLYPGKARGTSRPRVQWRVERKNDCRRLVALLDRYPLRSKKARDFAIWRRAVAIHSEIQPVRRRGPRTDGAGGLLGTVLCSDWTQLGELAVELRAVREYR